MFFVLVCLSLLAFANGRSCPIGTYDYSSLLANNCTKFDDTSQTVVILSGSSVRSLQALSHLSFTDSLAQWRGVLTVYNTTELSTLDGLQGLTVSSGTITIQHNSALASLNGLNRLTQSNGILTIDDNPLLTIVNMSSLVFVNTLTLSQLPITSLEGLGSIQSIVGNFYLLSCPFLTSLTGLSPQLSYINGEFRLSDHLQLSSLEGLEAITSVGTLTLDSCSSLESLAGLALSQCSGLTITNNPSLSSLVFPSSLTNLDGPLFLSSNPQLLSISFPFTQVGDVSFMNQLSIRHLSFPRLTTINGGLFLDTIGLEQLVGFSSLLSLSSLTCTNTSLSSLDGLQGIAILASLTLTNNPNLTSWNGLNRITTLGSLVLTNNPRLIDFSTWSSWTSLPTSHQLTSTCCPSYMMLYEQPLITPSWWAPCIDCLGVISVSPSVAPNSGGSLIQLGYQGNVEFSTVNVSFTDGYTYVSCNVSTSFFSCRLDNSSQLGPQSILVSTDPARPPITLSFPLIWVSDDTYYQFSSAINPVASVYPQTVFSGQLSRNNPATTIATWLIGSVLILLFVLSIVLALGNRWCGWCHRSSIRRFDCIYIYNEEHEQHQKQGKLLYRKQTVLGGVATIWIIIVIVSVVSGYLITILMDGNTSSIVLQPTQINNAFINSYSSSILILDPTNESCAQISTSFSGISPLPTLLHPSECLWTWTCTTCTLGAGSWSLASTEPNQFHHGYVWSLSSVDYFGSTQSIGGVIRPVDSNAVFQGSRSTLIDLTVNPSMYQAFDDDPLYGTQLVLNTQTNGSTVTPSEYGQVQGFSISITFTPFSSTTAVLVTEKEDLLTILSKMVSIVFGVFSITSYTLNLIYRIKYWWNRPRTARSPRAGVELPTP